MVGFFCSSIQCFVGVCSVLFVLNSTFSRSCSAVLGNIERTHSLHLYLLSLMLYLPLLTHVIPHPHSRFLSLHSSTSFSLLRLALPPSPTPTQSPSHPVLSSDRKTSPLTQESFLYTYLADHSGNANVIVLNLIPLFPFAPK